MGVNEHFSEEELELVARLVPWFPLLGLEPGNQQELVSHYFIFFRSERSYVLFFLIATTKKDSLKEEVVAVRKGDTWFPPPQHPRQAHFFFLIPPSFRAWRLHCESRNQGKGMLEVP